jgi:hypothetical protein
MVDADTLAKQGWPFGRTKEPGRSRGFVSLPPDKTGLAPMQRCPRRATIRDVSRTVLIVDDHEEFRHSARAARG